MNAGDQSANQSVEILIVEDSPTQAERLKHTLESQGYHVTVASNGRQGFEAAKTRKPTLIISDIIMPEMDGYELCKTVKSNSDLQDLPVILLTTLSDPQDVIRGLECLADNFILKPYDDDYLLSRIEYVIINQQIRRHESAGMGVEIYFGGNKHFITADRLQILNLLLSTYEAAIQTTRELIRAQADLRRANAKLEAANNELEAFSRLVSQEKAEALNALRQSQEHLFQSQKLEAVGQLAGGVAHDFNNLLTVIAGYSDMLARTVPGDPNRAKIEEIRKAAARAAALTRQLLAFSRRQVLQPKVFDLNNLVNDMAKMFHRLIGEDIRLVIQLEPTEVDINADPGQIEQVLMNLVVNARDALPQGGAITIETALAEIDEAYAESHVAVKPGSYALLAVSDNGFGIDAETKKHIFEPFFTTKEEGKGTGLGLSTVYGIVKQSGGNIWVYSEAGVGSTFKVYLPTVSQGTEKIQPIGEKATFPSGTEVVLLVEDEPQIREMTSNFLLTQGYKVLVAPNGEEALRVFKESSQRIQLIITDVVMPQMGGRELANQIATLNAETKILYMSGYTDKAILRHGVLEPGLAFIQKPFALAQLAQKVREVLDSQVTVGVT